MTFSNTHIQSNNTIIEWMKRDNELIDAEDADQHNQGGGGGTNLPMPPTFRVDLANTSGTLPDNDHFVLMSLAYANGSYMSTFFVGGVGESPNAALIVSWDPVPNVATYRLFFTENGDFYNLENVYYVDVANTVNSYTLLDYSQLTLADNDVPGLDIFTNSVLTAGLTVYDTANINELDAISVNTTDLSVANSITANGQLGFTGKVDIGANTNLSLRFVNGIFTNTEDTVGS